MSYYLHPKKGKGIHDYLKTSFFALVPSFQKYEKEHHAKDPDSGLMMNYLGPGTNLKKREYDGTQPINKSDAAAKIHDYAYRDIKNAFLNKKLSKSEAVEKIHKADDDFITRAENSGEKIGHIAANMMKVKKFGEEKGILPTKIFSGVGKKVVNKKVNPAIELIKEAKHMIREEKQGGSKRRTKKGGFAFATLLPFLTPLITEGISYVVDKIRGKGGRYKTILKPSILKSITYNNKTI